jgi:hypothetical protein
LQVLDSGVLTKFPVEITAASEPRESPATFTQAMANTNMPLPNSPRSVFICYAHADNENADSDKRWLDRFVKFLKPFVRQEEFTVASDQDLLIGDDWHQRIQSHLAGAEAAVLLVSPEFLASDCIANSEVPVLLKGAVFLSTNEIQIPRSEDGAK